VGEKLKIIDENLIKRYTNENIRILLRILLSSVVDENMRIINIVPHAIHVNINIGLYILMVVSSRDFVY